jgi:hypothetical protein
LEESKKKKNPQHEQSEPCFYEKKNPQHEQSEPCFYDKASSFSLPDFSDDSFQHMLSESITSGFLLTGTETLLVLMMHLLIQVQVVQPCR